MASQQVITALESLHQELEKLEPAIKHVETAQKVTETVKGIPQKHIELLKEVRETDVRHKGELKDLFSRELSNITTEHKKLAKTTSEIQLQVKAEQEALAKLKDVIQLYQERIEKINFPERLDKLDATIAGILAAVQSVQSRLDNVERNLMDKVRSITDYQVDMKNSLLDSLRQVETRVQKNMNEAAKKQQTNTHLTWALIIIVAMGMLLLRYLHR